MNTSHVVRKIVRTVKASTGFPCFHSSYNFPNNMTCTHCFVFTVDPSLMLVILYRITTTTSKSYQTFTMCQTLFKIHTLKKKRKKKMIHNKTRKVRTFIYAYF